MSGQHSFRELTEGFSPERRRRIDAIKEELLAEMPLHELRRARAYATGPGEIAQREPACRI